MFEFFTHLLKAFQNASKRQVAALIAFLIVLFIGVVCWERWTAGFRLTKLERASSILEHISRINGVDTNQVVTLLTNITDQLADILVKQAASVGHSFLVRLGLGFSPWFVLSLLFVPSVLRKGKKEASAVFGVWAIGTISAFICAFLPEGQWPWRHVLIYPGSSFLLFMIFVIVVAVGASSATKKKTEQSLGGDSSTRKDADFGTPQG